MAIHGILVERIIVDVILFIIVAGNAVLGYRKGLSRVVFSFLSTIAALILVLALYKPVLNYVFNRTSIEPTIERSIEKNIRYLFEKDDIQSAEQLQSNDNMSDIMRIFIGDEITNFAKDTKDSLILYVSSGISYKIIKIITFFALFAVIRILLYILRGYADMIARLPVVRIFNGSGGMIYGVIRGFLIIYVIFAIISMLTPIFNNTIIMSAIRTSTIGSKMFDNNIILNLVFKVL